MRLWLRLRLRLWQSVAMAVTAEPVTSRGRGRGCGWTGTMAVVVMSFFKPVPYSNRHKTCRRLTNHRSRSIFVVAGWI